MKRILIDASSAILLHKANLFGTMTTVYELGMVPSVLLELTRFEREGAAAFRRYQQLQRLNIVSCADKDSHKDTNRSDQALAMLGQGERETIVAFQAVKPAFIVLDDRKGAHYCRLHAIPYTNALLCVRVLYLGGVLSAAAYIRGLERLLAIGRYSPVIVEFVLRADRESALSFLP